MFLFIPISPQSRDAYSSETPDLVSCSASVGPSGTFNRASILIRSPGMLDSLGNVIFQFDYGIFGYWAYYKTPGVVCQEKTLYYH